MRNQYSFIAVWILAFMFVFLAGLLFAHIVYTLAMKDLVIKVPVGYNSLQVEPVSQVVGVPMKDLLEVKDNSGAQTDQYTPIQPAVDPTEL